jgi:hypothetical protein
MYATHISLKLQLLPAQIGVQTGSRKMPLPRHHDNWPIGFYDITTGTDPQLLCRYDRPGICGFPQQPDIAFQHQVALIRRDAAVLRAGPPMLRLRVADAQARLGQPGTTVVRPLLGARGMEFA